MNEIESQLKLLLQGKHFTTVIDCDFAIEDQIAYEKKRRKRNTSQEGRKSADSRKSRESRKSNESRKSTDSRRSRSKSRKARIVNTPEGPRPTIHDPSQSRAHKRGSSKVRKIRPTLPVTRRTETDFSDTDEDTHDDYFKDDERRSHEMEKKEDKGHSAPDAYHNTHKPKENPHTPTTKDGGQSCATKDAKGIQPPQATKRDPCKRFPEMLSPATHGRSVAGENVEHITLVKSDEPPGKPRYTPKVNSTVNYIVAALFINHQHELLLVEESSPTRKGNWGIPAGNVEHAEDFMTTFVRIMKQETGLHAEPTTLLFVEQGIDAWFRFVMSGKILGGTLKTVPDTFTSQAKWVKSTEGMKLRGGDEFKDILECGKEYFKNVGTTSWHANLLPVKNPHKKLYARIIYCLLKSPNDMVRILLMRRDQYHFPVCEIHPDKTLREVLGEFFEKLFGVGNVPSKKTHGVLCVEHSPSTSTSENDGLCITLLCSCQKQYEHMGHMEEFLWLEVSENLGKVLHRRMDPNMSVKWRVMNK